MGILPFVIALLIVVIISLIHERTKYHERLTRKRRNRKSDGFKTIKTSKKQHRINSFEDYDSIPAADQSGDERKSNDSDEGVKSAPAVTPPYAFHQQQKQSNNVQQQQQDRIIKSHPIIHAVGSAPQHQNDTVPEKISIESKKAPPSKSSSGRHPLQQQQQRPRSPVFVSAGVYPVETHNPSTATSGESNMPSQQNQLTAATKDSSQKSSKKKIKKRSPKNQSKQQESSSDASTSSKKIIKKEKRRTKNKSGNDSSKKLKKRKQQKSREIDDSSK